MTLLSEQLSAASSKYLTAPLGAQLNMFNALATQALDNASRITALNLSTSQEVIERSAQTARQLIGARDARDLAVLRSHAEEQVRSLFAYSRELFGIATSGQPLLPRAAVPAALAPPVAKVAQEFVDASRDSYETAQAAVERTIEAVVPAPVVEPIVESTPVAEPVVALAPEPAPAPMPEIATPDAAPTPIAQAAGNGAPQAAAAALPAAAPIERHDPDAAPTPTTPRRRKK